jgi:hypothetical protein
MKKCTILLIAGLCWIINLNAQQPVWKQADVPEMQKGHFSYSKYYAPIELNKFTGIDNKSIKTFSNDKLRTEPEIKWMDNYDFGDPKLDDVCFNIFYDSDNNSIVTSGIINFTSFDSIAIGLSEYNATDGSIIWSDSIDRTNSNHYPFMVEDMAIDDDGNIIISGFSDTDFPGSQIFDFMVLKYDRINHDTIWTRHFNEINPALNSYGGPVSLDMDNNIVVIGTTLKLVNGYIYPICTVYKLQSDNGAVIWMKELLGDIGSEAAEVVLDDQNNIYLAAVVADSNAFYTVLKLDPDGNEIWRYGGESYWNIPILAWNITLNGNNGVIVCGHAHPDTTTTGKDFAVAKLDASNGNLLWMNSINGLIDTTDIAQYLTLDESGNIYAIGFVSNRWNYLSYDTLITNDICVVKFDGSTGSLLWKEEFRGEWDNGACRAYDLVYDPSGYIIVTGHVHNGQWHMEDIFTVKLNAETGETHWLSEIDEPTWYYIGSDYGRCIDLDHLTGDVFVGGMMLVPVPPYFAGQYCVIRLGDDMVNISENSFNYSGLIQNYPNPFNSSTTISFYVEDSDKNTNITIYNFNGQKVKTFVEKKINSGMHQAVWDGTDDSGNPIPAGVYFYKMDCGDKYTGFKKMILIK